ncbi:hypothetical protein LDENG_00116190, partial [Lucifuga dentata]
TLQHLESSGSFAQFLFVDFSSAFNYILPHKLSDCLLDLGVTHPLALWILNFLQNRKQVVKINNSFSKSLIISTGAPQGLCVIPALILSALIISNNFTSQHSSVKTFKLSDEEASSDNGELLIGRTSPL